MKVALVHDWLTGMRGGERVLHELCHIFPGAPIFTLFHRPGSVSRRIESMRIEPSLLNRLPGVTRYYQHLLPLLPWAVSRFDLRGFDLIVSVSHAVAKGVRKPRGAMHICYCLTPMRYIWDMQADYFRYSDAFGIRESLLRVMTPALRSWDKATALDVDHFIADSKHVQGRIFKCYGRESDLIYPPVDTGFFTPSDNPRHDGFYLVVSALVPYKRVDIAIDAFGRLGAPLIVVGAGPDRQRLEARAGSLTQFRGFVSNLELRDLYRRCRAVIVSGREDFGLVSLEAQACGRPAVAYGVGGSLESIRDGETGILFEHQTVECLIDAVRRIEDTKFDPERLRRNAGRFSRAAFRNAIDSVIREKRGDLSRKAPLPWRLHPAPLPAPGLHPSLRGISGMVKRFIDVSLSLCGILVLGLPILLLGFFIRRDSPGPAFFFQTRYGLRRRKFVMIKLRTMRIDAERRNSPAWAVRDDPRCTHLGGFLRRYGIDEIPQLWNVLRGDMSLVGPRPERPEFYEIFEKEHPGFGQRLQVRAGITGLAQTRGWRGDTSLEERLRSDLEYIQDWSLANDLLILLRTPFSLLRTLQLRSHPPTAFQRVEGARLQQEATS